MDTAIEIPATGWIELYGSVAGDLDSFSIRLPVAKLLALGDGGCGRTIWIQA